MSTAALASLIHGFPSLAAFVRQHDDRGALLSRLFAAHEPLNAAVGPIKEPAVCTGACRVTQVARLVPRRTA